MVFTVCQLGAHHDKDGVGNKLPTSIGCLAKTVNVTSDAFIFTIADRGWGQAVYLLWCPVKKRNRKQHSIVHIDVPKSKHLAHAKKLKHLFCA